MAFCISKYCKHLSFKSIEKFTMKFPKRYLFSNELLGVENYTRQKDILLSKVGPMRDQFMERMSNYVAESESNNIFTDDLKLAVHFVETDKELETIKIMIKRFQQQKSSIKFSTFVFGPLVMRFLHLLNKPDLAKELFYDQEMLGFFSQVSSYLVFMDLLFINGKYEDVISGMDHLLSHNLTTLGSNMDCWTLYAASCYKLNTSDCFEKIMKHINKLKMVDNTTVSMRTVIYSAMLALNQNKADVSLDLLSMIHLHRSNKLPVAYFNVKLLTLARLGRFKDALDILNGTMNNDQPQTTLTNNCEIFTDMLSQVKSEFDQHATKTQQDEFTAACTNLQSKNRIDARSFDLYILSNIERHRTTHAGFKQRKRMTNLRNDDEEKGEGQKERRPTLLDNRLK